MGYEEKTEELLKEYAKENQIEIVDVSFEKEAGNWYLRIYIDKEEGIDIEDCEKLSRYIDPILDEEDYISETYTLEVSSPGLTRQLKKDKDLNRHLGDYVEIKLFKAYEGYKNFVGVLKRYDDSSIELEFEKNEIISFDKKNIASIKLAIIF